VSCPNLARYRCAPRDRDDVRGEEDIEAPVVLALRCRGVAGGDGHDCLGPLGCLNVELGLGWRPEGGLLWRL
jgi:hypothetical protein